MVGIYAAIVCDVLFTFICGVDGVHLQICYFSTYFGPHECDGKIWKLGVAR